MKVLMISGDKNILIAESDAYARLQLQRSQVDRLDVFVWPQVHSWREILKATKENKYDVVTSQDPFWRGLLAWKVAHRFKARLNVQVHTDLSVHSFFRRTLARFVLRRADSVRVVSEKIKKQVEQIGVRARIDSLPIFVDIEQFRILQRKPHEEKIILWTGRFEDEKDPYSAITVLKGVRDRGTDARLVMLGSGSQEQSLREEARGLQVEFPGWQDTKQYLETVDVVLVTSKHESWGASIVEALAAGVPVVALDVGVAKEAGAIVVPQSELASAVTDVLKSGARGELKLVLPTQDEWTKRWKETLL